MTACAFDAVLEFPLGERGPDYQAEAVFTGGQVAATISDYAAPGRQLSPFVRVRPHGPVDIRWKDEFEVLDEGGRPLGRGLCLFPGAPPPEDLKIDRRIALLESLSQGEGEMLAALAEMGGMKGVREEAVASFCRLPRPRIETLAQALEEEGRVRILAFSPLFLVSQGALDYLGERIVAFLARFHKNHPGRKGAPLERIEKRFSAPRGVLLLAIRALGKEGRVESEGGLVWLTDFEASLSPDDEKLLDRLEKMLVKDHLGAVTVDEIGKQLRLSPPKIQTLLTFLTDRRKIVEGKDGFVLHARWLDEIVRKIRVSGKRELSVADFKAMTGLTRKYAIPLLELLDEMGVTRRRGTRREIL